MNNFYAVFDIVQPDDDFSIVAVFSKEQDALDYPAATHKSIQKLPMEVILKILLRHRLNVCSEAIERLLGLKQADDDRANAVREAIVDLAEKQHWAMRDDSAFEDAVREICDMHANASHP